MKEKRNYIVKCDDCKKTIKENVTFKESVEGGICDKCRGKTDEDTDIIKIYEEDKYLLKTEGDFLKWINEHLSVILNEIEMLKPKKVKEVVCDDLYKIQKVIFRRIKKYYEKKVFRKS